MNKTTKTANTRNSARDSVKNSARAASRNCSAKTKSTIKNDCGGKKCTKNSTRNCK